MRTTVVRDVEDYENHLWFDDVPREDECFSRSWGVVDSEQPEDLWLQVRRRSEPKAPSIPDSLAIWVDQQELADSTNIPKLKQQTVRSRASVRSAESYAPTETVRLADFPQIPQQWELYLESRWKPWAQAHRSWQRLHRIYSDLFLIHQTLERSRENFELLVAVGHLTWKTPTGHEVRRHLLVAGAELQFDAARGVFNVVASKDNPQFTLEMEMLEEGEQPLPAEQRTIKATLEGGGEELWDRALLEPILSSIAHSLQKDGQFDSAMRAARVSTAAPQVTLAPCLILRKRSTKGYLAILKEIADQLSSGIPVPDCMAQVSGREDDNRRAGDTDSGQTGSSTEVFFPLPANEDQIRIVEKLNVSSGVHVQGPPGTGKSHTIANLICHLLATGKRILITAQTPRALKVLHEKLPEAMRPLCVSLMGNDKAAFDHLQTSVGSIVGAFDRWDPVQNEQRIEAARQRLATLSAQLNTANTQLRNLRERETTIHRVALDQYSGTATSIATRVQAETQTFNWFSDSTQPNSPCPVSAEACLRLLKLTRDTANVPDEDRSAVIAPSTSLQNVWRKLEPLFSKLRETESELELADADANDPLLQSLSSMPQETIDGIQDSVRRLLSALNRLPVSTQPWVGLAIQECAAGNTNTWLALHAGLAKTNSDLLQLADARDSTTLNLPPDADRLKLRADAEDLRAYLESGGSLGLLSRFKAIVKRTEYVRASVLVNGRSPDSPQVLSQLIASISADGTIDTAMGLWAPEFTLPALPIRARALELTSRFKALSGIVECISLQDELERAVGSACTSLIPKRFDPQSLQRAQHTLNLARHLAARRRLLGELAKTRAPLDECATRSNLHPLMTSAIAAARAGDATGYSSAVRKATEVEALRLLVTEQNTLRAQIAAQLPKLAKAIGDTPGDSLWDERLKSVAAAWHWAQAQAWLEVSLGTDSAIETEQRVLSAIDQIGVTTADLASLLAWKWGLSRMSSEHRRYFVAWSQSMRLIGKGTGPHAEKHRRDARANLAKCREAIPAWIMPLHQVYDSVKPGPELFDVIIVDEASQCGLDSRILTYLGKKLIVVGDDKQIGPEAVGVDRDAVFRLIKKHLAEVPHSESFQPEKSLFDFAELWFGNRVVLREHFRCMPEIIRFSSDLCYRDKPLIPLRQYPPDRLRPLVARRVAGTRNGDRNTAEAEAVVDAISTCIKDPRYKGLDMGVIALQGKDQAKLIESILIKRIEPKEIQSRHIICGDPYSFQGDERHVMFMSMVAAPNSTNATLTKLSYERRFNVAASRARDQMWLFHSIDSQDLSTECLRHRLLQHFYSPQSQAVRGYPIEEWRKLAARRGRRMGEQPKPFDSWFELDVYLRIVDRGFRVVPQFEIANSRIDLMIEGSKTRLAVECNGEFWHGPDMWEADQDRQRRLERAGLKFFTVWEGEFRRDPDAILDQLWERLEKMQIDVCAVGEELLINSDGYCPP